MKLTDIPDNTSIRLPHADYEHGVCVVRQGLSVFAYANRCPHMGMPMDWVEGQFLTAPSAAATKHIQCSVHGALFTIDNGLCVAGPCQGQTLTPVPVSIVNGNITI